MYAIAMDLGTTTLAASLMDSATGTRLAAVGGLNPQRRFGADVVARLQAAVESDGVRREMTTLVRVELRRLAGELCAAAGVAWRDLSRIAIAGNPAMQHLLLGLSVKSLAAPPFRPLTTGGTQLTAADFHWEGDARIYVFPMPGGFVGGDTVAFVFGDLGPDNRDEGRGTGDLESGPRSLYLDLGTNGELALVAGETVWATSAAAGPAFEGGNLSCGMAALPGAVSSVRLEGERVRTEVIGNAPPVGICGSGVIEAVSELLRLGIVQGDGRLRDRDEIPSNLASRVTGHGGENAFVIHRDARRTLLLTQSDIRQVQLACGAIRAGLEVLYQRAGRSPHDLEQVVVTGSFGAVLRPEWLKSVGIFDGGMLHSTSFASDGALAGVERALGCGDGRFAAVERLARRFRVVPLSGTPLFEKLFLKHLNFSGD